MVAMAFDDMKAGRRPQRQREKALRAFAKTVTADTTHARRQAPSLATALKAAPRRQPCWLLPAFGGVALLTVIALVVAHFSPAPMSRYPAPLALDPETLGIACLTGAAWAPDGSKLAILGAQQGCNASIGNGGAVFPDVVTIVDAASGHSIGQILPDANVQKALKGAGLSTPQVIQYSGVIWSPDGKRLALPFAVYYSSAQSGTSGPDVLIGLCALTTDGSRVDVHLVPTADTGRFTGEWNLKAGKPMLWASIPSNQVMAVGHLTLKPAALRYTWQPDGSLAATGLLNATSAPAPALLGPVGNPGGGASFTVWQPMQIMQNQGDPVRSVSPAPFVAYGSFLAWSPDGTYLLSAILGPWRIQPSKRPIPGPDQLKATFTSKLPLLPVRDAALDAAMNQLTGKDSISTNGEFSWSPNGRMLSGFKQVSGGKTVLTILDCASAKTLATITLSGSSAASANNQNGSMLWSPDGRRLLVMSNAELFILGQGALP